jgi:hypothetical protein
LTHGMQWTDNELIDLYCAPGLGILSHPKCDEIMRELKTRGLMDRARAKGENRARDHIAKNGTYRS